MSEPLSSTNTPWYKNYMVIVFVIGLPSIVVVTCIFFIFFATNIKDSTVRDDWYMDGKTLYQDASKDKLAYDLKLAGIMRFNPNGEVQFELRVPDGVKFEYPDTLQATISHATDQKKDKDFTLSHQQHNLYHGTISLDPLPSKYYLHINSEQGWRLTQTQKLPAKNVAFLPLPAFDQTHQQLPDQRGKRSQQ